LLMLHIACVSLSDSFATMNCNPNVPPHSAILQVKPLASGEPHSSCQRRELGSILNNPHQTQKGNSKSRKPRVTQSAHGSTALAPRGCKKPAATSLRLTRESRASSPTAHTDTSSSLALPESIEAFLGGPNSLRTSRVRVPLTVDDS
jgi:hypothetical protein